MNNIKEVQLELPFKSKEQSRSDEITPNNIINFSSALEARRKKEEDHNINKSIDRLLDYAAKLDW